MKTVVLQSREQELLTTIPLLKASIAQKKATLSMIHDEANRIELSLHDDTTRMLQIEKEIMAIQEEMVQLGGPILESEVAPAIFTTPPPAQSSILPKRPPYAKPPPTSWAIEMGIPEKPAREPPRAPMASQQMAAPMAVQSGVAASAPMASQSMTAPMAKETVAASAPMASQSMLAPMAKEAVVAAAAPMASQPMAAPMAGQTVMAAATPMASQSMAAPMAGHSTIASAAPMASQPQEAPMSSQSQATLMAEESVVEAAVLSQGAAPRPVTDVRYIHTPCSSSGGAASTDSKGDSMKGKGKDNGKNAVYGLFEIHMSKRKGKSKEDIYGKGPRLPMPEMQVSPIHGARCPLDFVAATTVFFLSVPSSWSETKLMEFLNTVGGNYPNEDSNHNLVAINVVYRDSTDTNPPVKVPKGYGLAMYANVDLVNYAIQELDKTWITPHHKFEIRKSGKAMDFKCSRGGPLIGQTRTWRDLWVCRSGPMDPRLA